MKIKESTLNRGIEIAIEKEFFSQLEAAYAEIPQGKCQGCTRCCSESVNAFFIEFIHIWQYLKNKPALLKELMKKNLSYYFLEMVEARSCPFLDAIGHCQIYSVRPLVCRQFGHWSRKDFEDNIQAVLKSNREVAAYFKKSHNMILPTEAVERTMVYCESFEIEKKMNARRRMAQTDALFGLDIPFLQMGLLDEDFLGIGLVSWFVYTQYDAAEAGELRLKIMNEWLNDGESKILETVLGKL